MLVCVPLDVNTAVIGRTSTITYPSLLECYNASVNFLEVLQLRLSELSAVYISQSATRWDHKRLL
jgi:hypothetical protein